MKYILHGDLQFNPRTSNGQIGEESRHERNQNGICEKDTQPEEKRREHNNRGLPPLLLQQTWSDKCPNLIENKKCPHESHDHGQLQINENTLGHMQSLSRYNPRSARESRTGKTMSSNNSRWNAYATKNPTKTASAAGQANPKFGEVSHEGHPSLIPSRDHLCTVRETGRLSRTASLSIFRNRFAFTVLRSRCIAGLSRRISKSRAVFPVLNSRMLCTRRGSNAGCGGAPGLPCSKPLEFKSSSDLADCLVLEFVEVMLSTHEFSLELLWPSEDLRASFQNGGRVRATFGGRGQSEQ